MSKITIVITDAGLFTKWVGAELVNAIDMQDPHKIARLIRNRKTLILTPSMHRDVGDVSVFVDALGEEDRTPIAIFKMSNELWDFDGGTKTEQGFKDKLAKLILENWFVVCLDEEDEEDEVEEEPVADKSTN